MHCDHVESAVRAGRCAKCDAPLLPPRSAVSEAVRLLGGVCVAVLPSGEFVLYKPNVPSKPTPPMRSFELGLLQMLTLHINEIAPADDFGFGEVVNALDRLRVDTNT